MRRLPAFPVTETWPVGGRIAAGATSEVPRCACGKQRSPSAVRCRFCEGARREAARRELADRGRILLSQGLTNREVAAELGVTAAELGRLLQRFGGHVQTPTRRRAR
jgi:hypothetical protein